MMMTMGDIDVPLRYQHLVKQWVPSDLPKVNTNFCVNERIYRIAPSSLHGLGLFCMDDIKVGYGRCTELMDPVTTTVIGCTWSNIHEVCIDMGCQQIIYN